MKDLVIIQDIFEESGPLAERFTNYEMRHEQVEMAEFVEEAIVEGYHAVVEAGTGTGKSLAYSVPLLLYSFYQGEKVAISTETRTLQKQLTEGEIPLLVSIIEELTGQKMKWSLCLGSTNYVCRYRLEKWGLLAAEETPEAKEIARIGRLNDNSRIVSRYDTNISDEIWNKINRNPDACLGKRCPFISICSHKMAKEEWQQSSILVMNHYLFFSNIQSNGASLPQFNSVVFDEAHSLEDICSKQMGLTITYEEIETVFDEIYSADKKRNRIVKLFGHDEGDELVSLVDKARRETKEFFERCGKFIPESGYFIFREKLDFGQSLVSLFNELLDMLRKVIKEYDNDVELIVSKIMSDLYNVSDIIKVFVNQLKKNYVYWVEIQNNNFLSLSVNARPVQVSDIIRYEILPKYKSMIFVSATLAIRDSFSYIQYRLGLGECAGRMISSPFDYQAQSILYTPALSVEPDSNDFIEKSLEHIASLLKLTDGKTLILFTSFKMLNDFAEKIESIGYTVYSQSEGGPVEAIKKFKMNPRGVLMGTHSMWQGIDLPGEMLQSVIIIRLPFEMPDNPVTIARIEDLQKKGIPYFNWYLLPQAVIRFKQGFGRLIRTAHDRGVVTVLDTRISSKQYGKTFLQSLPRCTMVTDFEKMEKKFLEISPYCDK